MFELIHDPCDIIYATMTKSATASQLRAARNAIGWSLEKLSKESGVSIRTLIRYEDQIGVPSNRSGNLEQVIFALESAGIEFIGSPEDRPGIRIGAPKALG